MGKGKTAAWTSHAITDSGWASDIPDVPGQTSLGTKKKIFSKVLYKRVDPSQCTQGTDCFFFKKKSGRECAEVRRREQDPEWKAR
jgi:hypothetical protein